MKKFFKKPIIFLFSIALISSSCSINKNNLKENKKELPNSEFINKSKITNKEEVSSRGRVLCFERAQKEKNAFLSEIAYDNCLLTIDKNLEEFDAKQADLYFLEKKENNKFIKNNNEIKKVKKKKKKKKKNKNPKIVNTKKKENSCKEGSIAGGAIGAGVGLATAKGKNKFWAVPAGGVAGALIGCQLDGG